jgi:hypothetical protein
VEQALGWAERAPPLLLMRATLRVHSVCTRFLRCSDFGGGGAQTGGGVDVSEAGKPRLILPAGMDVYDAGTSGPAAAAPAGVDFSAIVLPGVDTKQTGGGALAAGAVATAGVNRLTSVCAARVGTACCMCVCACVCVSVCVCVCVCVCLCLCLCVC